MNFLSRCGKMDPLYEQSGVNTTRVIPFYDLIW